MIGLAHTDVVTRLCEKSPEYHPRQWVDGSATAYTREALGIPGFPSPLAARVEKDITQKGGPLSL